MQKLKREKAVATERKARFVFGPDSVKKMEKRRRNSGSLESWQPCVDGERKHCECSMTGGRLDGEGG